MVSIFMIKAFDLGYVIKIIDLGIGRFKRFIVLTFQNI